MQSSSPSHHHLQVRERRVCRVQPGPELRREAPRQHQHPLQSPLQQRVSQQSEEQEEADFVLEETQNARFLEPVSRLSPISSPGSQISARLTTQRYRIVIQFPSQIGLAVGAFLTLQFHFLFFDSSVGVNTTMTDIRAIGHPEGKHKN